MKLILKESQLNALLESFPLDVKEDIFLKKDPKTQRLIIYSDLEDPKARVKETIALKNEFKKLGFTWDNPIKGAWSGPYEKLSVVNELIKKNNKIRAIIEKLEDLEEFIESDSGIPSSRKDELKTKIEMYITDLANATDAAAMDSAIRNYLTFYSKFHNYSMYNTLLILLQKRDATKVAGYRQWQKKFNRGVKKGGTPITIWVAVMGNDKNKVGPESGDIKTEPSGTKTEKSLIGFRLGTVYDISDTYPLSAEGEIPKQPQWWGENTPSETANQLIEKLKGVAESLGIKLTKSDAKGGEKGYSAGGHINLSSDVEGVGEASTLAHELAHELLHWKNKSPFYIDDPMYNTREMKELQAESVSYVIMKHYDLPVTQHPTYLVLWKANKEKIMNNLEIILKCAKFIINKIDGYEGDGEDEEETQGDSPNI